MRIEVSALARRDFDARVAYLLERNVDAAENFVAAIEHALAHLTANPDAGRAVVLKRRSSVVRRWNVPPMAVFYEVRGHMLYVIRIRHGARRPLEQRP